MLDATLVTEATQRLWSEGGFRSRRVMLGVGNQRVMVRDCVVADMPRAQFREGLKYQVADLLPMPVQDMLLDFYPLAPVPGVAPAKTKGLLVAAMREVVELNVTAVENARVKASAVDRSPFAMLRALRIGGELPEDSIVVLIGERTTYIVVVTGSVPQFVRIVPAGAESLSEAAIEATGCSPEDAEILTNRVGIEHGAFPDYAVAAHAMLNALKNIIAAVRSTVSYFEANSDGRSVSDLLLLGRGCLVPGLARAMAEHTGFPVKLGGRFPALRFADEAASLMGRGRADASIALGLALRGV